MLLQLLAIAGIYILKLPSTMAERFTNAHAHCFTIDHVPEDFFKALAVGTNLLKISKIKKSSFLRFVIHFGTSSFIRWIVHWFSPNVASQLRRLHGLIKYSLHENQEALIDILSKYYEEKFRFVLLSMDMEEMSAGLPIELFHVQLEKLSILKSNPKYHDRIYPFVFAEPRKDNFQNTILECLESKAAPFQGIKIYPAIGYYPFDKRLKSVYEYAIKHEIPVMTHCIDGPVYYRDCLWKQFPDKYTVHPANPSQSTTPTSKYQNPAEFQLILSHPLNYECLLNKDIATNLFGEPVDFSTLKLCIGHFGGEGEWNLAKIQTKKRNNSKYAQLQQFDPLDIKQPWLGEKYERHNWLTIIKALIGKYPNIYADISYTLHDKSTYPELKEMLADPSLQNKILFGTDYYVVASVSEEPELISLLHKHFTSPELKLMMYDNPKRYLSSNLNPIRD